MRQIKQPFSQISNGIKEDFRRLGREFTARSFFTILFGTALLAGNAYLFVVSTVKMFAADGVVGLLRFFFGLFGFLISCFLIFILTVHFSVSPQEGNGTDGDEAPNKMPFNGKRGLAAAIVLIIIALGGGATALGFYIRDEQKYGSYPQTTATVVSVYDNRSGAGDTPVYE